MADNRRNVTGETVNDFPLKPQRTVMLVEDSEVDRTVYRRYLQTDAEYEYSFIEVETGEEALEIYSQSQPDIVLLDYLLPDMNGLEYLAQWQQEYGDRLCPVVVLTGQGDENIAVHFIKLGAADYLVKSQITAEKLKLVVNKNIAAQQLHQTNDKLVAQLMSLNEQLRHSNQLYRQEIAKREKYKKIIANVPAIIYAKNVDLKTQQPKDLWLINQEFQKIFALAEVDVIGKTDRELFPPHIVAEFAVNDRFVIESKQPLTTEEEVHHGDDKLHTYLSFKFPLFDEYGRVTSIVGIATDITQQKQTQTQLLKSEIKFRNTFEQAAVGIAHVSLDGKWLQVNQKLCQIVGYTKEELLQKAFQDITHPDDLDTDLEYVRRMLAGEIQTYSLEKRYIGQNQEPIWINLTVSLVKDQHGTPEYFISVIEDISSRKDLELRLQTTLKRLSNLHDIDRAILAAKHPHAIAKTAISNIQKFITCQRISIVTFDWERETATILATQGKGDRLVGNGVPVSLTVWQETIARLENSDRDYLVDRLNQLPLLSQTFPILKEEGLDSFICFPLRTKGDFLGILKLWVEDLDTVSEELNIVQEACDRVAIALKQAHLNQQVRDYALELEARVAQRTAQLEEINQELKAFSYSISHDLKAPLRAIQGFATALQEDYADSLDDLGREYTERLAASAQQMERLIQDLLTYSRLSRTEIQKQPVNLGLIIEKAIEEHNSQITEAQAQITIDRPLLDVFGNRTILLQVINNLLSNALKFVNRDVRPKIHIWTEPRKNYVRLWIEDNGIGIKQTHQERIFQVFERLHGNEAYPGTGIGLAIVKKGIERLDGKYGVESEFNRGSRFWIEVPTKKG